MQLESLIRWQLFEHVSRSVCSVHRQAVIQVSSADGLQDGRTGAAHGRDSVRHTSDQDVRLGETVCQDGGAGQEVS